MCNKADNHAHTHDHNHDHNYTHSHSAAAPTHVHSRSHDSGVDHTSRRDFLRVLMGGALAGASVMELAYHRAAWARSAVPEDDGDLFDIQKAAKGRSFALSRPKTVTRCNAARFVRR